MKLPAYGRALIDARREGRHPACVVVIFGYDWTPKGTAPRLAVKPSACLGLDWSCVAGLSVQVDDRTRDDEDPFDEHGNRKLYFLLGEIARRCAWLTFEATENLAHEPAHSFAYLHRRWDTAHRRWIWPAWWSEEINAQNAANREQWHREAIEWLGRFAAGQRAAA